MSEVHTSAASERTGATPKRWKAKRLRHLVSMYSGATPPTGDADFWDGGIPWICPKDMKRDVVANSLVSVTESAVRDFGLRRFRGENVLIVTRGMILAKRVPIAVGHGAYTTNQDMKVLRSYGEVMPRYLARYLTAIGGYLLSIVGEAGHGTKALRTDVLMNTPILVPPLPTQARIAEYLDEWTGRIDGLIEKKRVLLERLAEKRQALITRAAIKGLNSDAPMKPSGIDWLGDIPAHWRVKRFRFIARLVSGSTPTTTVSEYWNGEIPWISPKDVKAAEIHSSEDNVTDYAVSEYGLKLHEEDNAIIVTRGMILAKKIPVSVARGQYTINQDIKVIRSKGDILPEFIQIYLSAIESFLFTMISEAGHGTKALRTDELSDVPMLLPPIDDQRALIATLKRDREETDQAIQKIRESIERLAEYRSALITAAVTGQLSIAHEAAAADASPFTRDQIRVLVGAEIVYLHRHTERFGRVKLQKFLYLAEAHANVHELAGNYGREAAGPFDGRLLDAVEAGMAAADYYAVQPRSYGPGYEYPSLTNAGGHRADLEAALGPRVVELRRVVELLRDMETRSVEAVATLYAVWNDAHMDGTEWTDAEIVGAVLTDWHPDKAAKFTRDELHHWLAWMRRNGILPRGAGPRTKQASLFG